MPLIINGDTKRWYEDTINVNGTTVSSPNSPGDVYVNGTRCHGLTNFSSATTLHDASSYTDGNGHLRPDSADIENETRPALLANSEAFWSQGYTQGPGTDTTYRVFVKTGYRIVSEDGTFVGTSSPGTSVSFYSGRTVTGINTSHQGRTWWYLQRDAGV